MAVQESYLVECNPATAFECAIKTLQTFEIDGKFYVNHRFMTVATTFRFSLPSDAVALRKILSISISPAENGYAWLRLACDHLPLHAYNKGNIILTIVEYLERYTLMLDKILSNQTNI